MSLHQYITTLKSKHAQLENEIHHQMTRPHPDFVTISALKKQKLRLKDMIGRLVQRYELNQAQA